MSRNCKHGFKRLIQAGCAPCRKDRDNGNWVASSCSCLSRDENYPALKGAWTIQMGPAFGEAHKGDLADYSENKTGSKRKGDFPHRLRRVWETFLDLAVQENAPANDIKKPRSQLRQTAGSEGSKWRM